jgi:hypothetical protein
MFAWTDIHRALPCAIDARALPLCVAANNPVNLANLNKIKVQTTAPNHKNKISNIIRQSQKLSK